MIQFDGNVLKWTVPVSELVTAVNRVSNWPIELAPPVVSLAIIRNWKKIKLQTISAD